jgi:hypothetical protein
VINLPIIFGLIPPFTKRVIHPSLWQREEFPLFGKEGSGEIFWKSRAYQKMVCVPILMRKKGTAPNKGTVPFLWGRRRRSLLFRKKGKLLNDQRFIFYPCGFNTDHGTFDQSILRDGNRGPFFIEKQCICVPDKSLFIDDHCLFREIELHHLSFALNIFSLSKSQSREKKDEANNEDNSFSEESYFHVLPPLTSPPDPSPQGEGIGGEMNDYVLENELPMHWKETL